MNMDGDEIVPSPAHCQRSRKIGRLKIRDEKHNCTSCDDLIQVIERQRWFRSASLRFEKQNLTDEPQSMGPAFFWRNEKFNAIGKENEADLVIVSDRAEGEQAGDLCGQLTLGLYCAAKISRSANIDNQHHG